MSAQRPPVPDPLVAGLGTAVALGLSAWLVSLTEHSWLLASLGGSCVILFGRPTTDMAQPRSFIGGHLISTVVGLLFLHGGQRLLGGPAEMWMVAAVATALAVMLMTGTVHSPAGANPIVIFMEGARWSFLISPLAIGMAVLFVSAYVVNNRGKGGRRWPLRGSSIR